MTVVERNGSLVGIKMDLCRRFFMVSMYCHDIINVSSVKGYSLCLGMRFPYLIRFPCTVLRMQRVNCESYGLVSTIDHLYSRRSLHVRHAIQL